jgi:redox-sensitive bicupin YhaK (pirin superfamily)
MSSFYASHDRRGQVPFAYMVNAVELIIPGREISLGGFTVKRVLPYAQRRMVGPFIFWDHMGPHLFGKGFGMDIAPHPHIGLSTLTYLMEGRAMHRDSLGNEAIIQPGEVNWMTAGSGIAHSERTATADLANEHRLQGMQLWVALPDDEEDRDPSFVHVGADKLPILDLGVKECRLVAGSALGKNSPVPVYSPMFLMDVKCAAREKFVFDPDQQEIGVYVAQGEIQLGAQKVGSSQMVILKLGSSLEFSASEDSRVFVFGGQAFTTPRHVWWNFVSSGREKIEEAKRRWEADEFPPVINESRFSRLPLPQA